MTGGGQGDRKASKKKTSRSKASRGAGAASAEAALARDVESLPFDQYQRYRLVSDLLAELREGDEPLHVLDVGGRTALLREFLGADRITLVDPDPSEEPGLVLGDGCRLPFQDGVFDVVCAFDTLEHVPPEHREAFVSECRRVARRHVVLAGPYEAPRVVDAERELRTFMKEKLVFEHRYLEEHHRYGLPVRADVETELRELGGAVVSIGHGNLDRWLVLMCLSMYMDHEPVLRGIAKGFHRFYNRALYASDHAEPVYRHVVVAAFDDAPLPSAADILDPPVAPQGSLAHFQGLAEELLAFDSVRDVWKEEVRRLHEVNDGLAIDLEGHRTSLEEIRERRAEQDEVLATLETDLAGHKESLEAAAFELEDVRLAGEAAQETHAAVRAQLEERIDEFEEVVRTQVEDLTGHKERIESLETELADVRAARVESEEAHAAALAAVQAEVDDYRGVVATLETDLDEHKRVVAVLRTELDEVRAAHEEFAAQHEVVRAALEADVAARKGTIEHLERDLAEARAVLEEARTVHTEFVAQHEEVKAAFEADIAGHGETIDRLRADLERLRATHDTLLAEHADQAVAFRGVVEELKGEIEAHQRVKAEHEGIIADQQAVLASWAGELSDRWRNVKRAVRWKIPDYGAEG